MHEQKRKSKRKIGKKERKVKINAETKQEVLSKRKKKKEKRSKHKRKKEISKYEGNTKHERVKMKNWVRRTTQK